MTLPAGAYRSVSIRLKSNINLEIASGATLVAATREQGIVYDTAEASPNTKFQDYGHSHFHNSLIWGEDLENVTISVGVKSGARASSTTPPETPTTVTKRSRCSGAGMSPFATSRSGTGAGSPSSHHRS